MEGAEFTVFHDVAASPKTDVARLVNITVKKVWNTDKSAPIPHSVAVQLLRNKKLMETAILNDQNNWQTIYANMPETNRHTIKEVNIPNGFTPTYSRKGYEFTVTNTASLAQARQPIWPIPVFALVGMTLLMLGFVILQKSEKNNA